MARTVDEQMGAVPQCVVNLKKEEPTSECGPKKKKKMKRKTPRIQTSMNDSDRVLRRNDVGKEVICGMYDYDIEWPWGECRKRRTYPHGLVTRTHCMFAWETSENHSVISVPGANMNKLAGERGREEKHPRWQGSSAGLNAKREK